LDNSLRFIEVENLKKYSLVFSPLDGVDVGVGMDAAGGRYRVLQEHYLPVEGLHRFPIGSSVCNK